MNLSNRLDKLEAANDAGIPLYIFKWSDESEEQAIARFVREGGAYDPDRAVFIAWGGTPPIEPSGEGLA
jgi:hypothetical protein